MTNAELAAALREIPGVEDAEIGAEEAEHEGVRVRLTSDADPNAVAEAVRAILADRGLRSRMAPPRARVEPSSAPPPPVPVGGLVDVEGDPWSDPDPQLDETQLKATEEEIDIDDRESDDEMEVELAEPPIVQPQEPTFETELQETFPEAEALSEEPDSEELPVGLPVEALPIGELPMEESPVDQLPELAGASDGLASLRMEEDRHGVTITAVANDGTVAVRKSRAQEEAIQNGVIAAVSALFDPHAPAPAIVAVEESIVGDAEIITVVLDDHDGQRLVGAAVMAAERGFAVARATFAALADR